MSDTTKDCQDCGVCEECVLRAAEYEAAQWPSCGGDEPVIDECVNCGLPRDDPRHDMSKWPESGHAFKRPLGAPLDECDLARMDEREAATPLPVGTISFRIDEESGDMVVDCKEREAVAPIPPCACAAVVPTYPVYRLAYHVPPCRYATPAQHRAADGARRLREEEIPREEAKWREKGAAERTITHLIGTMKAQASRLEEIALNGEEPEEAEPLGTFACPICGVDTPHPHDAETTYDWQNRPWLVRAAKEIAERDGFERYVAKGVLDERQQIERASPLGKLLRPGSEGWRLFQQMPATGYCDPAIAALFDVWCAATRSTMATVRKHAPVPGREPTADEGGTIRFRIDEESGDMIVDCKEREAVAPWSGGWNNWIAPFHACPRCTKSLNWLQCGTAHTAQFISATCCGIHFNASLR